MRKEEQTNPAQLVEGPVGSTLIRLTIPMIWGMLAVTMFNIVDTYFVGQLGARELAAMSFTFPASFAISAVAMGMGIGVSSVIARAIGEGGSSTAARLTTDALLLAVLTVTGLSLLGLTTMKALFHALGASKELSVMAGEYMRIWYLAVPMLFIPMVANSALRATGDTKTPSLIMVISGLANIVLDPIFIFGLGPIPRMELEGAALASGISWMLACIAVLWLLDRRRGMLAFVRPSLEEVFASWRRFLYVGAPAMGTNLMLPLSSAILTRIVAGFGDNAVAAFGVGNRLEMLAMSGCFALSTATAPFVGQNFGAGHSHRVRLAVHRSVFFSLVWGGTIGLLYLIFAGPIARLFNDDPAVVATTMRYLFIVPLSYGAYGALTQINATFNAMNAPLRSTSVFVLRLFILAIPLAYICAQFWGITGVFLGIALANLGAATLSYIWIGRFLETEVPTT